jgi:membrane protease YdiL (CAAX protease family)
MNRRKILLLSCLLFFALTLLSWLGFYFRGVPMLSALSQGETFGSQIRNGLLLGFCISGLGTVLVLGSNLLQQYRNIVVAILGEIRPRFWDLVFISLGAGWSEELFFRGLLQPTIGLWWASVLFWLAHGAISLTHWGINLYGLCVLAAGVGLGYLYESQGLLAAMTAHAALDATTLLGFHFWMKTQGLYPIPERTTEVDARKDPQPFSEEDRS